MTQLLTDNDGNAVGKINKEKNTLQFIKIIPLHKMSGNQNEQIGYFLNLQKHVLDEFLMKTIPSYTEFSLAGYRLLSSSASIELKPGIKLPEELQVTAFVSKIGETSVNIAFVYRNQHDKVIAAIGVQTILFYNLEGKAAAVPEDAVTALSVHLMTAKEPPPSEADASAMITNDKKGSIAKKHARSALKRSDLIPRKKSDNYTKEFITSRRQWAAEKTKAHLHHIGEYSVDPEELKARVENMIGIAQIPLGLAGPLRVNGEHAKGLFYVPMATTEGTLVETYQRGMLAVTMAGGANVRVIKESLSFSPIFILKSITDVPKFLDWTEEHFAVIKSVAETTTKHGKLIEIVPYVMGRRVILDFRYTTGDAMGMNMICEATEKASNYIMECTDVVHYHLASNLSSEKKASYFNFITGYGKEVQVEATFSQDVVLKYLGSSPKAICEQWFNGFLGGAQAGMIGINCHIANAIAAMFMACGQDVAQTVNAGMGTTICESATNGALHIALKLPNILVGTVGGGAMTGTAKECLDILDCAGPDRARKFAEIIGATLLAGEASILAALASGNFAKAHMSKKHARKPISLQDHTGDRIA